SGGDRARVQPARPGAGPGSVSPSRPVHHPGPRALDRPNELVQLQLNRASVPVLRVLDQEHHQEGDDGGKTSAEPTKSELRRANFRNRSCMSAMYSTGYATRAT